MRNTQNDLVLWQRRMQQRQILAMMGIEQWVQPSSPTISMANVPVITTVQQPVEEQSSISESNVEQASSETEVPTQDTLAVIVDYDQTAPINADIFGRQKSTLDTAKHSTINAPVAPNAQGVTQTVEQWVNPLVKKVIASAKGNTDNNNSDKIAPFDLQGGRYGNWVLLVDIQVLNNDSQKLWQNITQALSLSCETSSFPICAGMDTAELANASFAGYIFKIGRSEEVQVAALTALPDGLDHPKLVIVPTLDEILTDSMLKRQLWQQLSDQN